MSDDDTAYRSLHTHRPEEIAVREADDLDADGMMEVRMPIASTGDVRNEDDDPLSGAELRGMAQQVDSLTRGVFPEHGMSNAIDADTYSQFEKLGYWADADLKRDAADDGEDLLVATARMPDPETLPAATGDYREALAILKEQAMRGIPIAASIGWRDDEDAPGGVDLMEASIVGIGADPRTQTEGGEQLVARAAVKAGVDPDTLVDEVRAIVDDVREEDTPADARPLGPPGDRDRFDTFEECVDTLSEDMDEADAEQVCGAWENASQADDPEDTHDMTDDDTPDEGTTDGEQTPDDERADEECPECGYGVRDEAKYCSECGEDLREDDEMDDDEEEEDEDDDEEEQSATPDETQTPAEERLSEMDERLDSIEDTLAGIRAGEIDLEQPDTEADDADADADDEAQRDTDDEDSLREEWLTHD